MISLHYHPGNASFTPHVLLRELGLPFRLQWVDRAQGAHKSAEYLKLNPNGQIPVLVDGDLVLYETVAIVLHLVDAHPQAGLAPAPGSAERAHFYKWLVWMTNTLQATLMLYFYPERWFAAGHAEAAAQLKAQAERKVGECLAQLNDLLAGHGGPWLMGERFGALDIFGFMLCRWTRGFAASRPAREYPHLGPWLQRVLQRPATQQAIEAEQLPAPWV